MNNIPGHFQDGFTTDPKALRALIAAALGTNDIKIIVPDNSRLGGETPKSHEALPADAHVAGDGKYPRVGLERDQAEALIVGLKAHPGWFGNWCWDAYYLPAEASR
jgi:hypothetical protein